MLSKTLPATLLLAFILSARAGLDLTATKHDFVGQGVPYQQLLFKDEQRTVSMDLPGGWTFQSAPTRLNLRPPDKNFVEAAIEVVPLPAHQVWDDAAEQGMEQNVVNSAPGGSQGVAVVAKNRNAVVVSGYETFEVVLTYQTLGNRFRRSVMFVNCPEALLVFRLSAPVADFDTMNQTFRRAALSWRWH